MRKLSINLVLALLLILAAGTVFAADSPSCTSLETAEQQAPTSAPAGEAEPADEEDPDAAAPIGACCYSPADGTTKCEMMTSNQCAAADTAGIGVMYWGANAMKNCKKYCSGESW